MFLSTTITSAMLDATRPVTGASANKFSVPYNFVRGRNLLITIAPGYMIYGSSATLSAFSTLYHGAGANNRTNIVIPDNVDVHTANIDVEHGTQNGTSIAVVKYTLQVTFDTVNNTITFVPTARSTVSGTPWSALNGGYTAPTLLQISTIL